MKMNKSFWIGLPVLFLIAGVGRVGAQGTTLSLSLTQLQGFTVCPDTVYHGQFATVQATVQNVGPDTLIGDSLYLDWMSFDTVTVSMETIAAVYVQQLLPNDTFGFVFTYQYDSMRYKYGGNIVVVWPRSGNSAGTAIDSVHLNICFDPYLTLVTPAGDPVPQVVLAPNPAGDMLTLHGHVAGLLEHVRIFDFQGRLVLWRRDRGPYDLRDLPAGLYVVEVKLRRHEALRRKLIHL